METVHTIGRRKASVARIYISKGKGNIIVNGKDYKEYFPLETLQHKINQPLIIMKTMMIISLTFSSPSVFRSAKLYS